MKCLYLGHETAQWYWEHAASGSQSLRVLPRCSSLADSVSSSREVREVVQGTPFEHVPLHVLTDSFRSMAKNEQGIFFHTHAGSFPRGAFIQLSQRIFVSSPQLSFVQISRSSGFGRAFRYGCSLCGSFALDDEKEFGIVKRERMLSAYQLRAFVEGHDDIYGVVAARKVAQYLVDNSASPRETAVMGALSLPLRYGGMGLSGAYLNRRIDIPKKYNLPGKRQFFVADLLWPDAKVAVEYDSDAVHAHKYGIYRDSEKRKMLISMGYTPLCITSIQLDSPSDLALAADAIRRALGKRRRPVPKDYDERVAALRKELGLPWFEGQKTF